jgi:hypothetical protein
MFARRNVKAAPVAQAARPARMIAPPPREHVLGNQALLRQLQAKLTIGAVTDPLEHEADAVASRVMGMAEPKSGGCGCGACAGAAGGLSASPAQVQRKGINGSPCNSAPDDKTAAQGAGAQPAQPEEQTAMAKAAAGGPAPALSFSIPAPGAGGGMPLPAAARAFMDPRFGEDFSGVRVHADRQADSMNRALGAEAFTLGADIYFREGRFQPGTRAGGQLLAHELAHVVQQRQGRVSRRVQRYTLQGFPAAEAAQMRAAIPIGAATMRACNGPWLNNSIAGKIESATYEYVADLGACAHSYPVPWSNIQVGSSAFAADKCCKLESTLAHEASHTRAFIESRARALERACFGC